MRKFAPLFFVLSAFLLVAAVHGGEAGQSFVEQLRQESQNPDSNVLRTLSKDEQMILYVDKEAFNEIPSRVVILGQEVNLIRSVR